MIVHLAERISDNGDDLEPIGIYSSFELAKDNIKPSKGLITTMEVDVTYGRGIGVCDHKHI